MTPKVNPVTPLASPLGEEGHEVAKGWTVVRMIMILLFYVLSPFAQGAADWRSGPRWTILSVLCPVHTFPLRGTSPQEETRDMREKQRVIYFMYHFGVFPLWWLAPPPCPVGSMSLDSRVAYSSPMNPVPLPPPQAGALWMFSNVAMSLQESMETYSAP
ncbi:hypothetical protein HMPREF9453_00136 [Dialister succinatiphilus YIT 11850]|uniref:Uncharacterized protein n=1 Tax=Dialister succinatiphilus YIT 11850 TaxID=742743 RepID=H1CXP8_9FIRM|nr:hypothetical protein HMPREF9453_00136 [Dialister succinatiphilus YIT 11850]